MRGKRTILLFCLSLVLLVGVVSAYNQTYIANTWMNISDIHATNITLRSKLYFNNLENFDNTNNGWIRTSASFNVTTNLQVGGFTYFDSLSSLTGSTISILSDVNMTGMNITSVEAIHMDADEANHVIQDNASCIIIKGDTSTLNIC